MRSRAPPASTAYSPANIGAAIRMNNPIRRGISLHFRGLHYCDAFEARIVEVGRGVFPVPAFADLLFLEVSPSVCRSIYSRCGSFWFDPLCLQRSPG